MVLHVQDVRAAKHTNVWLLLHTLLFCYLRSDQNNMINHILSCFDHYFHIQCSAKVIHIHCLPFYAAVIKVCSNKSKEYSKYLEEGALNKNKKRNKKFTFLTHMLNTIYDRNN